MRLFHNHFNAIKSALILVSISFSVATLAPETITASQKKENNDTPKLLVLDDCDKDNNLETPPCGDAVFLFNSNCELKQIVYRLKKTALWGRNRAISASEDGRSFVVCENNPEKITMYETATGRELWSLSGIFESAVFVNDLIYVLSIENIYAIDNMGTIIRHGRLGGTVIAVDKTNKCIWIADNAIKKCSLNLELLFEKKLPNDIQDAAASSIDVTPNGSVWVALWKLHGKYDRGNYLLKVSPDGKITKTVKINYSPIYVRVDKSDGSVWTIGMTSQKSYYKFGDKYDSEGNFLLSIEKGRYSIEIDPSDKSVWIADTDSILHYSSTGEKLGEYTDVSDGQKWLAVIPVKKTVD